MINVNYKKQDMWHNLSYTQGQKGDTGLSPIKYVDYYTADETDGFVNDTIVSALNTEIVEYQKLEFIENINDAYIDTEYLFSNKTDYEIQFSPTGVRGDYQQYFAGSRSPNYCPKLFVNNKSNVLQIEGYQSSLETPEQYAPHIRNVKTHGNEIYVDGELLGTVQRQVGTDSRSFYIFNGNEENTLISYMRLYYLKVWEDGELVREYIPVLDANGTPCLYEKFQRKYYYSKTSNTFVCKKAKEEFTRLNYIQNVSNSYVDTNYFTSNATDYEIKFEIMGTRTGYQQYFAGAIDDYYCPKIYQNASNAIMSIKTYPNAITTEEYLTPDIMIFRTDGENVYVNDNNVGTVQRQIGTNTVSSYVFNSHSEPTLSSYIRLYYLKIWENGILVREYIPVKDAEGVICLYDTIEKKYYYNQGSGNFTYA